MHEHRLCYSFKRSTNSYNLYGSGPQDLKLALRQLSFSRLLAVARIFFQIAVIASQYMSTTGVGVAKFTRWKESRRALQL